METTTKSGPNWCLNCSCDSCRQAQEKFDRDVQMIAQMIRTLLEYRKR